MVGRGVDRSVPPLPQQAHDEETQRLDEVRLSGYRFLRPPGVSKTLKLLHEEQDYEDRASQNSSVDYFSFGTGPSFTFEDTVAESENVPDDSDDAEVDFTGNLTLPTMNASLPSIYLPPPNRE